MTTLLEDARAELVAVLEAALPTGRVHATQPPQPAAPMVWLGAFNLRPDTIAGAPATVAEATVYACVDGNAGAQVKALDVVTAQLWQALDGIASVTGAVVGPVDVGGPRLYGVTVSCDLTLTVRTLCPDTLTPETIP
jgi:hypothetical protein